MKKVLYAFILVLCLVGGLGVGLVYRKHLADQQSGGGDPGPIVAANDTSGQSNNPGLGIPGAIATTTAPDAAAGDVSAALAAGGQPASTMAPATPAATQADLSTSDVTGRNTSVGQPMTASDFTPSSSGDSSSSTEPSTSSSGGRHHHHGSTASASAGSTTTTFSNSAPLDGSSFGTETGGDATAPKSTRSGRHGKAAKATPAPTAVASAAGGTDAEMPTIDDNSGGGTSGGGSAGGGSDPFGTMDASTPEATPEPTRVAMIPKGGGELDFPAGSGASYLKKVTQRQNGDKSIIHVDLAGSASYRVIALRNPSRVFIDFEETSVPGGNTQPVAGTVSHVKEITAKQFTSAGGISIARVQITLTDDKVPGASKGTADGGLDVVLGEKQDSF